VYGDFLRAHFVLESIGPRKGKRGQLIEDRIFRAAKSSGGLVWAKILISTVTHKSQSDASNEECSLFLIPTYCR